MKFADRVGVCVHTAAPAYKGNTVKVQAALEWLGVTHVRDRGTLALTGLTGVQVHVVCPTVREAQAALAAGAVSIEGPNEPNTGSGWEQPLQAVWAQIVAAVAGKVPVLTPAMNEIHPYDNAGPLPADFGNVHCYRNNDTLAAFTTRVQIAAAGQFPLVGYRPWICTETGWSVTGWGSGTGQAVVAAQLVETLAAIWAAGAERVYLYELVDEPDKAGREGSFGLFTADWQPKPIADALKAFLATYGQDDDLAALTLRPRIAAAAAALNAAPSPTASTPSASSA